MICYSLVLRRCKFTFVITWCYYLIEKTKQFIHEIFHIVDGMKQSGDLVIYVEPQ